MLLSRKRIALALLFVISMVVSSCGLDNLTQTPPPTRMNLGHLIADIQANAGNYLSNLGGSSWTYRVCGIIQGNSSKKSLYKRIIAHGSNGSNNDLSVTHTYYVYQLATKATNGTSISLIQDLTSPSTGWGNGASNLQATGNQCYEVDVVPVHRPAYTPPNDPNSYLGGDDAGDVAKNIAPDKWQPMLEIDKPITQSCYNQDDQCQ
jgi:hypothetical protein